jgi:hypothetical protein
MLNLPNNIDKNERIVRGVIGGILIVGGILGFGPMFMLIVGILLIAEAAISYCGIIDVMNRMAKKSPPPSGTSTPSTPPPPPPPSSNSEPKV